MTFAPLKKTSSAEPGRVRVLHTSDWHLGRSLYGRRRYQESAAFLDWLVETIDREGVEVLLVAGDVFDSLTPSTRAQTLYYGFLGRVATQTACRHVVIIAGNHDSPALLTASDQLLKALDIHVVGTVAEDPGGEIIVLRDGETPRLVAAAVPYPRDRDLRESTAGESAEDKERRLTEAIAGHYRAVGDAAQGLLADMPARPPVVGLGHLFAAGGRTVEGDGVRSLYVGSLGMVAADIFPANFDYLALGHLHQPQVVGGDPTRRYSGAPLAMTFAEAGRPKSVSLVDFIMAEADGAARPQVEVSTLEVPVFQRLERLAGNWDELAAGLDRLLAEGAPAWLEIDYTGAEIIGDLKERLAEKTARSGLEILRLRNHQIVDRVLGILNPGETLDVLDEDEVFRRCLDARDVPEAERPELLAAYAELRLSAEEERP